MRASLDISPAKDHCISIVGAVLHTPPHTAQFLIIYIFVIRNGDEDTNNGALDHPELIGMELDADLPAYQVQ